MSTTRKMHLTKNLSGDLPARCARLKGKLMDGKIEYLNTDLDLTSAGQLTDLAEALKAKALFPLHVTNADDGLWYAKFETEKNYDEPEKTIKEMITAIETLEEPLRAVWFRCTQREFNIGYDCGTQPWAFEQGLTSYLLGRIAALGASLRLTLYPDREGSAQPGAQTVTGR